MNRPLASELGSQQLLALLLELPRYIRPRLTAVGAAAVVAVTIAIRRPTPVRK